MFTIDDAILIAKDAHEGAVDKGGHPYILHPLRIAQAMTTDAEKIAAILHDVVEDSDWDLYDLEFNGLPPEILTAVKHLTRRTDEDYFAFIRRCAQNPIARAVKRADIVDNCDLSRIANPTDKDQARVAKYQEALAMLDE